MHIIRTVSTELHNSLMAHKTHAERWAFVQKTAQSMYPYMIDVYYGSLRVLEMSV